MTIYERIAKTAQELAEQGFAKTGEVTGAQKYKFIPITQILDAVRKAQAKNGVFAIYSEPKYNAENNEKRWSYVKKTNYGETTWYAANGHIDVAIFGADGDYIQMSIGCEAQDNSDKLNNKLLTNAMRSVYRSLYNIDEGSPDPEAEYIPNDNVVATEQPKAPLTRQDKIDFIESARADKEINAVVNGQLIKHGAGKVMYLKGPALDETYAIIMEIAPNDREIKAKNDREALRKQVKSLIMEDPEVNGPKVTEFVAELDAGNVDNLNNLQLTELIRRMKE